MIVNLNSNLCLDCLKQTTGVQLYWKKNHLLSKEQYFFFQYFVRKFHGKISRFWFDQGSKDK